MSRIMKSSSAKIGLKPGTVKYIGEARTSAVTIEVIDFTKDTLTEVILSEFEDISAFRSDKTLSWINIIGLHEAATIEKIGTLFDIHPLVLEDIVNTGLRPKIEEYDNYIFISLKMISLTDKKTIKTEQVSLILADHYLLTFQEDIGDVFEPVRNRIRKTVPRNRLIHSDYLAHALIDAVVDHYFTVLEDIGSSIEEVEEKLIAKVDDDCLETIHTLKRELTIFRKPVWPLREVIGGLERSDSKLISKVVRPYIRDLYEHVIQVIDTTETFRDMVTGLLDLYLSQVSNRMNEVMKVLTIIATIFIPLGFLAGVYGMNFDTGISPFNMPELGFKYGYIFFWSLVVLVGGGLTVFFKKKRWF